jgi:hypothetical protein
MGNENKDISTPRDETIEAGLATKQARFEERKRRSAARKSAMRKELSERRAAKENVDAFSGLPSDRIESRRGSKRRQRRQEPVAT